LFGRLADQRAAARQNWIASQAARDAVRLSVGSAAASGYVTLLALDARLGVTRQTLALRDDSLRLIRRRVEAGYSPKLELEQAEADYQAAARLVPQAVEAITRQENGLRLLTGDVPGPVERGRALEALLAPPVPDTLPSELLARRPDIAQAEATLAATDKSLAAARKRFLPSLRLSAAAGAVFSSLLADPVTIWSVGGSVLAPLFEGGRLRAGAETAAAQRDQAAESYRRAALTAFHEADDALAGVASADAQLRIGIAQRDALAESYRLARNRYRAGYSPFLEQLDAQRGLLAAELALVQSRSDALTARITLYRAMGGGWTGAELPE
jgi:NodT family efflux transporter outer membrane factor (OMF) lipoprotein